MKKLEKQIIKLYELVNSGKYCKITVNDELRRLAYELELKGGDAMLYSELVDIHNEVNN